MPLWLDMLMTPMAAPESRALRRMRRTWQLLCVSTAIFVGFFAPLKPIFGKLAVPLAAGLLVAAMLYTGLYLDRKPARRRAISRRARGGKMRRLVQSLVGVLTLFAAVFAFSAKAEAAGAKCTGKFVNPITDVCWSCLFPLSVGGLNIWPSDRPDPANPASPICFCGSPLPRIGISVGFWEPARLADVTMKPWCFTNLGGMKIAPGFDIGQGYLAGPSMVGGRSQSTAKWHVHWYVYPLLYWMEILTDFACFEQAQFDIAYMTEIDPLWQDDSLTTLINPEAIVFANPIAQVACAGDCVAATARLPLDELFWCAGCQGSMYPLNGNIPASIGHVQSSRLALSRFAYKMHREALAWGSMGSRALCGTYPMPIMRKQQYRFQMVNPTPTVSGRFACSAIGASTMPPDAGRAYPAGGEDMGYLVWRKRNCCVL